jgi:hypothetical protein
VCAQSCPTNSCSVDDDFTPIAYASISAIGLAINS